MATNHNYSPGCGVCLGVFHVIFGLGGCGCGVAAIVLRAYAANIAVGVWAGVAFYLVAGILGLASASRNNAVITGFYVLALLSVFVAMGQMGMYVYVLIYEVRACFDSAYWDTHESCTQNQIQDMIMHGVMLLLAFLEWIIAMVSCCTACTCCFNNEVAPTQTVVIHTVQQPVGQPVPNYGGPAVAMSPPQANYSGYAAPGFPGPSPASVLSQPAPGYSEKPQLPLDSAPAGDPPVYQNPAFEPVPPSGESAARPGTPPSPQHDHDAKEEY